MKNEKWKEAAQLITELIVSKVAPRKFWRILFENALALLDPMNGQEVCL